MLHSQLDTDNLFEWVKLLGQQTDLQTVLELVVKQSNRLFHADSVVILMVNPDTRETIKTINKADKTCQNVEYHRINIHVGGWIIKYCKTFYSKNIQTDRRFAKDLFADIPMNTILGVPLIIEGTVIGALILLYKETVKLNISTVLTKLEGIAAIAVPFLRNVQKIRNYFTTSLTEPNLLRKYKNAGLMGKSPEFINMLRTVEAATNYNTRVLLIGNTGVGKELVAHAIHNFSNRSGGPFIALDCGAIPGNLIESEFFGHKKGAFTGANADRKGLFIAANGGTIFLDEINNLPLDMQSKLLRVLEEKKVRPMGSNKPIPIDVRIIAASSVSLKKYVEQNKFREDLFYRLYVYPIYIPSLEERKTDIPLLVKHFLKIFAGQQNKKIEYLHEEVIDFIKQRNWKGNIRELENFVERLVTLTPSEERIVTTDYFPKDLYNEFKELHSKKKLAFKKESLKNKLDKYESKIILQALLDSEWNQSEAARQLNTSEKNIRNKMEKYSIKNPRK